MKNKLLHMVKGLAVFAGIYLLAQVIVEMILIVGLSAMGFDPLHGQMPDSFWVGLFPLYGFAAFALLSILFQCVIRKKKLADMQMRFHAGTIAELLGGMAGGALLVAIAILILIFTKAYQFDGISAINTGIMAATFFAYLIQGFAEELLCRGLLQNYFEEKLSRTAAIFLSALVFILPHVATIMDYEPMVVVLSLVNLLLVSILFSLSMIRFKSVWVPAGIHIGWNFVLSYICGITLSGGESSGNVLGFCISSSMDWLHGGAYGIEAGFISTIILVICDLIFYKTVKEIN